MQSSEHLLSLRFFLQYNQYEKVFVLDPRYMSASVRKRDLFFMHRFTQKITLLMSSAKMLNYADLSETEPAYTDSHQPLSGSNHSQRTRGTLCGFNISAVAIR